jgi:hypothetical protein
MLCFLNPLGLIRFKKEYLIEKEKKIPFFCENNVKDLTKFFVFTDLVVPSIPTIKINTV